MSDDEVIEAFLRCLEEYWLNADESLDKLFVNGGYHGQVESVSSAKVGSVRRKSVPVSVGSAQPVSPDGQNTDAF